MLKFVKIQDPSLKLDFLNKFDPKTTTFICSDIKNKQFLENYMLQKYQALLGDPVLRAHEFYKKLFTSINKKWSLKSDAFVEKLLTQFLENHAHARHLTQSQIFFKWFQFCFPFFLQDPSGSFFKEWSGSKKYSLFPESWFPLFQDFFKILEDKKLLYESGVKAVLLNESFCFNKQSFKKERLVVDLVFSMDLCEKELFKELAQTKEVFILAPVLDLHKFFENKAYDFYSEWEKEISQQDIITLESRSALSTESSASNVSFFKWESRTQHQEIQQALCQVSKWLQQGVKPQDIVIYAPNIEKIWFHLKYHLEKNSIPYQKTNSSRLFEFKEVKYLLSCLRFCLNQFEFEDLEQVYFYKDSKKNLTQLKKKHFKVLNKHNIQKTFLKDKVKEGQDLVSGFKFVEWVLSFWPFDISKENSKGLEGLEGLGGLGALGEGSEDTKVSEGLLKVLKKLLHKELLSFSSWFSLLESEVFSQEIELETEKSFGISCLSFNAFHSVKSPYAILLGLTESIFKSSSLVREDSLSSLLDDLGFALDCKLPREQEKSFLWFLQSSHHKELYLSRHSYDLTGNLEGEAFVSMFVEWFLEQSKSLVRPLNLSSSSTCPTFIEDKEKDLMIKIRSLLQGKSEKQIQAIGQAFFERDKPLFHPDLKSLSVSQIKTYGDCPFKYAAKNIFLIPEDRAIEQEISPLIKGGTVHELFRNILERNPDLNLTEKQKEELIEELIPKEEHFIFKEEQILFLKQYLKELIEQFLIKEKEQKEKHSSIKAVAFEAPLQAFWNQKEGKLSTQGDYLFKGTIDRVDWDAEQNSYIVRDYKASLNQLTHISSWLKNDDIQLLFYAQALREGLVENLKASEVSTLFYSAYNDEFKTRGFVDKESGRSEFLGKKPSSYSRKPKEELEEAIKMSNQEVQKKISLMEQGVFSPNPKKQDLCEKCEYKNFCRVGYV